MPEEEGTQQSLEEAGGDDDAQPQVVDEAGDEAEPEKPQRGRPSANAQAAQRRLDREKAELKSRLERLEQEREAERTTLSTAKQTLDKLRTALSPDAGTTEEAPPDPALYPDAYNKYLQDREARLKAEMEVSAARIADTRYAQREATARNLRVEQEFLAERPDWDQDKFLEFAKFLGTPARSGRTRFNPTGEFGEWTKEDLDIAELAFDKDGALLRERVKGRNATLDAVSGTKPPANPGARKPGGPNDNRASNGMTMDDILAFVDKRPQEDVNQMLRGLKPEERQTVNRVIARIAADLEKEGDRY